ncbi:MAG: 50S ribosomal protein L30 [Chloroflexi bacterium]|nr:50S ribosomal protein L30 [Chloroflexota bacterium]
MNRRLHITMVKSGIGSSQRQKDTLRALGLRRLRQTVEQPDSPTVRGMIAKVQHLVKVQDAE